jgi:hypothetical protein
MGASDAVYEAAGGVRPEGFFTDRFRRWCDLGRKVLGAAEFTKRAEAGRKADTEAAIDRALERVESFSR